jgi:chlorobactene glucosyltransferase
MTLFLATAPWLLLLAALPFLLRQRPTLGSYPARPGPMPPMVSVVVPTRDDAARLGACLASLLDSSYPAYEVVVADAGSEDGTREIVAALEARSSERVRLLNVGVAPVGHSWRGWCCWQGFQAARGELVLFTDPGSFHESDLMGRAVSVLEAEDADLVSVYPRLSMHGFWERLVMPHLWLVLSARLATATTVNRWQDPAHAVASRHFLLFRRAAYEATGGHEGVREGDPEAVTLARAVLLSGGRLFLAHGEDQLETRMYRTLGAIADELDTGAPASLALGAGVPARVLTWLVPATPLLFFVVPPLLLAATLLGLLAGGTQLWAVVSCALALVFWLVVYARHRIRPAYAVAFPAGALVSSLILMRALLQDD